jgi:integration host factor subunit alpha
MPKTLTKADIIAAVSQANGFSLKKSVETLETVIELIKRSLESGEDVLVSGFGKFCVKEKAARRGRNPATDEDIILRPRRVVTFRYSHLLREKINQT